MSIAAKDGNGAALTLNSTTTATGEAPGSTPVDPTSGAPFRAASDAGLASILGKLSNDPATQTTLAQILAKLPVLVGGLSPVQLSGLLYPASTANSSAIQILVGGAFTGSIETIQNQQAAQIQIVCDQPYRVDIIQYIDAAGLQQSSIDSFTRRAGAPFNMNVTMPGNYFRVVVTNLGIAATIGFKLDTTFGIMNTQPRSLGRKDQSEAFPVVLSDDDADTLSHILQALGPLMSARGASGELRISVVNGTLTTLSTVTTVGTVTTVSTVTTVGTVTNQSQVGGYSANNHIPALMNSAASSNIDRMVG